MPSGSKTQRPAGLVILGALEVLLGGLSGLLAVFVLFLQDKMPMMPPKFIWMDVFMFLGLALLWMVLGIGSFMAKRWARALVLITAWSWLVLGTLGFGITLYQWIFPDAAQAAQFATLSPGTLTAIHAGTSLVMLVLGTILPLVLVLYYSRDKVREACESLDPGPSWVDGVPLPVMGLCLWMFLGGLLVFPMTAFFNFATIIYGVVVSGVVGGVIMFICGAINLALAWGLYRLRIAAWWASLVYYMFFLGSLLFYSPEKMQEVYQRMEMPVELTKAGQPSASYYMMAGSVCLLVMVGYMVFIKRYFKTTPQRSR